MNFQKILRFIIILIFIVIIIFQFGLRHSRFFFGLYSKLKKKQYKQNNYFKGNFEKIFKKYYHSEINSKDKNKLINCSRNVKNQYALLDKSISRDILPEIKSSNNNNPEIIMKLLKRIIKFVHLNGKAINLNDCFVIDCLRSKDIIFPFFHTDVEWNSFCENNGFQVWMLLKAGKQENKGNMFIMETPYVSPGKKIEFSKKDVFLCENGDETKSIIRNFKDIGDLNPKIRYLNCQEGETFIMNPCVFHTTDPRDLNSNRVAINFRVIIKQTDYLKICLNSSHYTKSLLLRLKNIKIYTQLLTKKGYIIVNENNQNLTSKLIY